jgi:16S rRNA (adenine1518-N6/adenine1519-N6)-dimethyltransferase
MTSAHSELVEGGAHGSDDVPTRLRPLLERHGLRPRKSLGQHFLVNRGVLKRIVSAANLSDSDTVIEVGPGLGVLTRELLANAGRVIAVEKDEALATALRDELGSEPRLEIVTGDFLTMGAAALLRDYNIPQGYKVVANLPYNVATAILRQFFEAPVKPQLLVVLLQREVAKSLAATPGDMGLLAVATQLYAVPELLGVVRPGSFFPPPKVDSSIVRLTVRERPSVVSGDEAGTYLDVVRAGFSAPRKQLANSLGHGMGLPRTETLEVLKEADISPKRRAETLSLEEWARVYRAVRTRDTQRD